MNSRWCQETVRAPLLALRQGSPLQTSAGLASRWGNSGREGLYPRPAPEFMVQPGLGPRSPESKDPAAPGSQGLGCDPQLHGLPPTLCVCSTKHIGAPQGCRCHHASSPRNITEALGHRGLPHSPMNGLLQVPTSWDGTRESQARSFHLLIMHEISTANITPAAASGLALDSLQGQPQMLQGTHS